MKQISVEFSSQVKKGIRKMVQSLDVPVVEILKIFRPDSFPEYQDIGEPLRLAWAQFLIIVCLHIYP